MKPGEQAVLDLVSRLLDYPDAAFFAAIPAVRDELRAASAPEASARSRAEDAGFPPASASAVLTAFLDRLEAQGTDLAQQAYVATFDHDTEASPYLAWHRYGNDRGQGRALAALNGLYRASGLEPEQGALPDYLPRVLEFLSLCEDWAAEVLLDGFGPELAGIHRRLVEMNSAYAPVLGVALEPLKARWPQRLAPRTAADPTIRPLARPEPETPLCPTPEGV